MFLTTFFVNLSVKNSFVCFSKVGSSANEELLADCLCRVCQSYRVFTVLVCFVLVFLYLVCFSHLLWFIGRSSCLGQPHQKHTVTYMNTHSFCCQLDKNKVDIFMLRLPFVAATDAGSGGCPRLYFQCNGMRHLVCDLCAGKTNQ